MGKAVITGWIDEEANTATADAAEIVPDARGSKTGMLQIFANGCQSEMERLKAKYGDDIPPHRLSVKMVPLQAKN